MATDPTTQNVYITGISSTDMPDWATEETQREIIKAINNGAGNVYKATSVNANIGASMNSLLGQLVMIMKGDKKSAVNYTKMIQEQAALRKQVADLSNGISTVAANTDPGKASTSKQNSDKTDTKTVDQYKKLNWFEQMKLRRDLAGAKSDGERNHILRDILDQSKISSGKLDKTLDDIKKAGLGLGAGAQNAASGGNDMLGAMLSMAGGPEAAMAIEAATALYSASQVPLQMMMQQVKDRFEITTELRQSGLLEDLGSSFVDVTKSFSDNNMTIVEATQFVREFSKAVGVMGTKSALQFVNQMAYSTNMMERFGLNFSQVAKISGTYLDTLERTGMLEQISASERDRGMTSFMSAVEGVSMTLKTSLEESAKMISEYLSRDDISSMLMTSSSQLSQEVITQIGAMAKMGPLGEIVAKGAIDPNRFMLTPEFQKLNNPALAGVRGIVEQMMNDLRSGRGTDELIAQYGKRMSDIIKNDPVVGQLVAMDSDVASIVAGVGRLAQTSQDAIKDIVPPAVDQAERRRQDAERLRAKSIEGMYANILKTMDTTRDLEVILNDQTTILEGQIHLIEQITSKADAFAASLVNIGNEANKLLIGTLTDLANGVMDLFPEHHVAGQEQDVRDTSNTYLDTQENQRRNLRLPSRDGQTPGISDERASALEEAVRETQDNQNFFQRNIYETEAAKAERIKAMQQLKDTVAKTQQERDYIDTLINETQAELTPTQAGGRMSGPLIESYLNTKSAEITKSSDTGFLYFDALKSVASGEKGSVPGSFPWSSGSDPTEKQQATATEQMQEAQAYAVTERFKEILPQMRDSAGGWTGAKSATLAQESVNVQHDVGMSGDEVRNVINELFNDQSFVQSLGEDAQNYKQALLSELQTATNDIVINPIAPVTVPVNPVDSVTVPVNPVDPVTVPVNPVDPVTVSVEQNRDNYTAEMETAATVIQSSIMNALKDGIVDDADLNNIANKVANGAAALNIPQDQMNTVIEGLKSDEGLKQALGDNFNAVATALNSYGDQMASNVENNTPSQEVVTVPSSQSFLDAMSTNGSPVTEGVNSELYTKMADLTGGIGDDFNQAAQTQFGDFLVELQRDKNLNNEQMISKLTEIADNITTNKAPLEDVTGKTDVRLLLGAIQDLIRRLQ